MRKLHIASLLLLTPVLMGSNTDELASKIEQLVVNYLPICKPAEYLTYSQGGLICAAIPDDSGPPLPDCNKSDQLLTYTEVNGIGTFGCVDKGTESLDPDDIALINQTKSRLLSFRPTVDALKPFMQARSARYCGQYSAAQNPNGAMTGKNGVTGVAGAASLCASVSACGTGARMCSVYDLYNSVVLGAMPLSLPQSWVHMSAWQHDNPAQVPAGNGLADNCSGWTYGQDDKLWYGTTVEWKRVQTGQLALHFASGPGVVPCSARFPIACCK